ncbi:MAG: tol-pal system protein YbgF [Pseudomonadota bacterium]
MSRSLWLKACAGAVVLAQVACANAAVPVEESVEEAAPNNQSAPVVVPPRRAEPQRRSLGIPPTIEPTAVIEEEPAPAVSGQRAGMSTNAQLFYQLQVLQEELQALRGLVEEQQYQIKRLEQNSATQYRDLDRRIAGLGSAPPGTGGDAATAPEQAPVPIAADVEAAGSEREAYQQAFGAMQAKQYDASMTAFQGVIEQYPNGQFTAPAFYWLGELHLLHTGDVELARQSFMQVINLYPDHQKAGDSLYKLGVVYSTLGEVETARDYLQRVQLEHPGSSAASKAAKYAEAL